VLDGFPRTIEQARALDAALAADGKGVSEVIDLQVSEQVLMERLTGRWICRQCQTNYHLVFNPPKTPGRCDVCGGELYQRADDRPETVARRLQVYREQTYPLVDYYRQRGVLLKVDGEGTVEEVHRRILDVLDVAAE